MWWPSCPYYEAFPPRRVNVPPLFACMLFFLYSFPASSPMSACLSAFLTTYVTTCLLITCLPPWLHYCLPEYLLTFSLPVCPHAFLTAYLIDCLPVPYLPAALPFYLPFCHPARLLATLRNYLPAQLLARVSACLLTAYSLPAYLPSRRIKVPNILSPFAFFCSRDT